jgi:tetratricopeptide (TPR) repeat protein
VASSLLTVLHRNLRRALDRRELQDAGDILANLQAHEPLSLQTRGFALELALAQGRLADASSAGSGLLTQFPNSARIRYLVGRVAYAQRDYREAKEQFRAAHALHPNQRVRQWLGKTLTQLGEFDAAEVELLAIAEHRPWVHADLAWLYERRGDQTRALASIDKQLLHQPDNDFARAQRTRLAALALPASELVQELETLQDLGEDVPTHLADSYVRRLLETGAADSARSYVAANVSGWPTNIAVSVGWQCYHASVHDLAFQLLLLTMPERVNDFKHRGALERSAKICNRVQDVIDQYVQLATTDPRFYGHIKRLDKFGGTAEPNQ